MSWPSCRGLGFIGSLAAFFTTGSATGTNAGLTAGAKAGLPAGLVLFEGGSEEEEESEEEDGEGLASLPREDSPTRGGGSPGTSALLRNMPPLQMRRAGNPMPNLLARRRTGAAGPPALGLPSMNEEQEYNDEESDSISDLDSQGSPSSRDVSPTRSAMGALGLGGAISPL